MDASGHHLYNSCMKAASQIPEFTLFGETSGFPDLVHCEHIHDRAPRYGWMIAPHRHGQMAQILVVESGRAHVAVDGERRDMMAGEALFLPPQVVHGFGFDEGTSGQVLSFPLPVLQSLPGEVVQVLARPFAIRPDAQLAAAISDLTAAFAGTGTYRAPLLLALAQVVLLRAAASGGATPRPASTAEAQVARFDALIARHGGHWRVAEYADALAMTPGHLGRLCRKVSGHGAGVHLDRAVMAEACRLLAFTRLQVAEVGFRLGYADPPHFSRRFRAVTGETPTAYRDRFSG